jgi:hypothetical protein
MQLIPSPQAQAAMNHWEFTPERFLEGGLLSEVWLGTRAGIKVVLKVPKDPTLLLSEICSLILWHPTGLFPRVLDYDQHEPEVMLEQWRSLGAFLMSYIPGDPLVRPPHFTPIRSNVTTKYVTRMWQRYHQVSITPSPWLGNVQDCHTALLRRVGWAFLRTDAHTPRLYDHVLPAALSAASELTASAEYLALCHGDLTFKNLLRSPAKRIRLHALDPLSFIGDPVADLAHWLVQTIHLPDVAGAAKRAVEVVASTGIDPDRLHKWMVIDALLEASHTTPHEAAYHQWLREFGGPFLVSLQTA